MSRRIDATEAAVAEPRLALDEPAPKAEQLGMFNAEEAD